MALSRAFGRCPIGDSLIVTFYLTPSGTSVSAHPVVLNITAETDDISSMQPELTVSAVLEIELQGFFDNGKRNLRPRHIRFCEEPYLEALIPGRIIQIKEAAKKNEVDLIDMRQVE